MSLARRRGSGGGSPSAYGGVGLSPMKRKSPFKRRVSGLARPNQSEGGGGGGSSANIKVAVRVRPENEFERQGGFRNVIDVVDDRLLVFDPKDDDCNGEGGGGGGFYFQGKLQNKRRDLNKAVRRDHKFFFDSVLGPAATNDDVFAVTMSDLVDVVFDGYNCSVFVYGATGAGKTHTMLGTIEKPGIAFLTIASLFAKADEQKDDYSCEISASYLEVYNEAIVDLINPSAGQLAIREDAKSIMTISGLSVHRPSGPEGLKRLLEKGNANRKQHPTDANKQSSRSHSVFQVVVRQTGRNEGLSGSVKTSKLSMIDLAGSEKGSATSSRERARIREGSNINKSLLALGNCINALADGSKYVPYRNSKLTRLLKDSIGGNCRTVMISNVSPSSVSFEDTYNTLKYADRAKRIKLRLKKNLVSVDFHVGQYAKIVDELKAEVSALKAKAGALQDENAQLKKGRFAEALDEVDSAEKERLLEELGARNAALEEENRRLKDEGRSAAADVESERLEEDEGAAAEQSSFAGSVWKFVGDLKKDLKNRSEMKMLALSRKFLEMKFNRSEAVTLTGEDEGGIAKLRQFARRLEKKSAKLAKRCKRAEDTKKESYESAEAVLESKDRLEQVRFKAAAKIAEEQLTNEHLVGAMKTILLEADRTEKLLLTSLEMLKKSHLLLRSFGHLETVDEYNSLASLVHCSSVQFRDRLLCETNLDDAFDHINSPYRCAVDLMREDDNGAADPDEGEETTTTPIAPPAPSHLDQTFDVPPEANVSIVKEDGANATVVLEEPSLKHLPDVLSSVSSSAKQLKRSAGSASNILQRPTHLQPGYMSATAASVRRFGAKVKSPTRSAASAAGRENRPPPPICSSADPAGPKLMRKAHSAATLRQFNK